MDFKCHGIMHQVLGIRYQVFIFNLENHQPVATVSGTQKRKAKKDMYTEQMLKKEKRKMNTTNGDI